MKISSLLCSFIIITACSGCVIRVSIEDGCDRVSGVPKEEMSDVIDSVKENPYEEIDSDPSQEDIDDVLTKTAKEEKKA